MFGKTREMIMEQVGRPARNSMIISIIAIAIAIVAIFASVSLTRHGTA